MQAASFVNAHLELLAIIHLCMTHLGYLVLQLLAQKEREKEMQKT
jgi:hypothetical protein